MTNDCDRCGLSDPDCQCYVMALEKRIEQLEADLIEMKKTLDRIIAIIAD